MPDRTPGMLHMPAAAPDQLAYNTQLLHLLQACMLAGSHALQQPCRAQQLLANISYQMSCCSVPAPLAPVQPLAADQQQLLS